MFGARAKWAGCALFDYAIGFIVSGKLTQLNIKNDLKYHCRSSRLQRTGSEVPNKQPDLTAQSLLKYSLRPKHRTQEYRVTSLCFKAKPSMYIEASCLQSQSISHFSKLYGKHKQNNERFLCFC